MLRVFINGLLLSSIKRSTPVAAAQQRRLLPGLDPTRQNLFALPTCRSLNTMDQPFEKMAEEGVPQATGSKQEELQKEEEAKALPKLSPQEFRKFNALAEKMNYFVRISNNVTLRSLLTTT
jgi:hypothetical protein